MLPALLLASNLLAEGQPPVRASIREDRKVLKLEIETGALPRGSELQVRLLRDVSTLKAREGIEVLETVLPLEAIRDGSALLELGEALSPGCYRVRVGTFDLSMQEDLLTPAYLEAVKRSEERMGEALREVGDILDRMGELEALCAEDRDKGLEGWKAWHPEASKRLKRLAAQGHDPQDPFLPEIRAALLENLVQRGLIVMELRKFQAAQAGHGWDRGGLLQDQERFPRKGLESFEALWKREALWYRLTVFRALVRAVSAEASRKPSRPMWDQRRKSWERLMESWTASLDPGRLPAESLSALGQAWKTWVDAQQASLFEGGSAEASRRALEEAYAALEAKLKSGS